MTRTRRLRKDKVHVFPLTSADSIKGSEFLSHFTQEGWMNKEQKKILINLWASVQIHGRADPEQPAVRTVTETSRAGAGLCSEPVQRAVIVSPICLMAWPDVTLARSICLFSTFSITHLPLTENKHIFSHKATGKLWGGGPNSCLVTKML